MPGNLRKHLDKVFDKEKQAVKTIRADLGRALSDKSVIIHANERGAALTATIARPIPRQLQGLPLELTVEKSDDDEVRLTDVKPSIVASWRASPLHDLKLSAIDRSVQKFADQFQQYLHADTPSREDFQSVIMAGNDVEEALLTKYAATPPDDIDTLNAIARLNREIVDFQRKAQFGSDDNYWPEVYSKMYADSRSVVAIAVKGRADPIGTGTLIGKNLILTCGHVFTENPTDHEVWFGHEETSKGRLPKRAFPISAVVFKGKAETALRDSTLDYVLVEIGLDPDGKDCATYKYRRLPLTTAACHIDDSVYVIGHPRGGLRTIHDNARIHFPFRLAGLRKAGLDARVRAEIEAFVNDKYGSGPQRDRMLEELYQDYQESFVKDGPDFRYVHELRGPAIGIDSDTYGGDSGAPTLLRRGSGRAVGLIGILVGGAAQSVARATWLTHEVVLPITEVISQLNTQVANWQTRYSVTVHTP